MNQSSHKYSLLYQHPRFEETGISERTSVRSVDGRSQLIRIINTSHTHQGEWCLESLFCRGPAERVRDLAYRLRDFDAVRRVKVMVIRDEAAQSHRHE